MRFNMGVVTFVDTTQHFFEKVLGWDLRIQALQRPRLENRSISPLKSAHSTGLQYGCHTIVTWLRVTVAPTLRPSDTGPSQ